MPHIPSHPSARKRHRQSLKRQARNRAVKTRARTVAKQALDVIQGNDKQAAEQALRGAMKVLYKAASKGTIKRNTAARKVARLSRRLHRTHAAAAQVAAAPQS
ncbi:MAG TPA: 30S ribosomal protein S20 [Candidatus Binataceae bacterium]|nr:30S ribosomal protein S20 [Candidatus Binataceae bacterium]